MERHSSAQASAGSGAQPNPSGPVRCDVTPWRTEPQISPLPRSAVSECGWASMKPGATMRPAASMTVAGGRVRERPDGGDPAIADGDVGDHARRAGAVDDGPAADEEVGVHPQLSLPRARSGMTVSTTPSRRPTNAS